MQFARRSSLAFLFILCFSIAALAQTAANARIVVQDIPPENSILVVGPPSGEFTFEFAHRDPANGNIWIDLNRGGDTQLPSPTALTPADVAGLIAEKLNKFTLELGLVATWNNDAVVNVMVAQPGAAGNDYSLYTDADELCIGGFCGGSD